MWQSSNAFGAIHDSLSFFRNAYDEFASYRAAIIRLDGLVDQNTARGSFTAVSTESSGDGEWRCSGSRCAVPTAHRWCGPSTCRMETGEATGDHRRVG